MLFPHVPFRVEFESTNDLDVQAAVRLALSNCQLDASVSVHIVVERDIAYDAFTWPVLMSKMARF